MGKALRLSAAGLLSLVLLCGLPNAAAGEAQYSEVMVLCGIASLSTLCLVAFAYMVGIMTQNDRFTLWAKSEVLQAALSVAVASLIIFALFLLDTVQIAEISNFFRIPTPLSIYDQNGSPTIYSAAKLYLENLAAFCLANIASIRYDMGAYEIRTTYTEFECDPTCLISFASINLALYGGETAKLAVSNNLLNIATVSYLTTIFQYFTLLYIENGLFLVFLPIAMVVRSVPFMRQFGGALVAVFVALYLLYPLMICVDAYLAPSLAYAMQPYLAQRTEGMDCAQTGWATYGEEFGGQSNYYVGCVEVEKTEYDIKETGISRNSMSDLNPTQLEDSIRLNALVFITAMFFPALNFMVIAAFALDISRVLGSEVDIARLGQMI